MATQAKNQTPKQQTPSNQVVAAASAEEECSWCNYAKLAAAGLAVGAAAGAAGYYFGQREHDNDVFGAHM